MIKKGLFIVICGIDGCGKTTQEELLAQHMANAGHCVFRTKNPSDWYRQNPTVRAFLDSGTQTIRPETMALLAAADRMIQLDTEILPHLERGTDVICNRYKYSSFGYFSARKADMNFVGAINGKAIPPDKGILITIDPDETVRRIRARDHNQIKYEERDPAYLATVQQEMLRCWPENFLVVNGSSSVQSLSTQICEYVCEG